MRSEKIFFSFYDEWLSNHLTEFQADLMKYLMFVNNLPADSLTASVQDHGECDASWGTDWQWL
jgi:hypothetical protein